MTPQEYEALLEPADDGHTKRYGLSAQWIEPFMGSVDVLDFGGESRFSKLVRTAWPQARYTTTGSRDLRYTFNDIPDRNADIVLAMEVIEHVKDRDDSPLDAFTGSGISTMLSEAYRVLRPGGHLFLSTPNVCCLHSISQLIDGKHPFFYEKHHRELSWDDTEQYLRTAGFRIERMETPTVWGQHTTGTHRQAQIVSAIQSLNSTKMHYRGDCIFCIARK